MKVTKKHLDNSKLMKKLIRTMARRDYEACYSSMVRMVMEYRDLLEHSEAENEMWRDFYKDNKKELTPIVIQWNKKRDTV